MVCVHQIGIISNGKQVSLSGPVHQAGVHPLCKLFSLHQHLLGFTLAGNPNPDVLQIFREK
jgi:hypothetical protein